MDLENIFKESEDLIEQIEGERNLKIEIKKLENIIQSTQTNGKQSIFYQSLENENGNAQESFFQEPQGKIQEQEI